MGSLCHQEYFQSCYTTLEIHHLLLPLCQSVGQNIDLPLSPDILHQPGLHQDVGPVHPVLRNAKLMNQLIHLPSEATQCGGHVGMIFKSHTQMHSKEKKWSYHIPSPMHRTGRDSDTHSLISQIPLPLAQMVGRIAGQCWCWQWGPWCWPFLHCHWSFLGLGQPFLCCWSRPLDWWWGQ